MPQTAPARRKAPLTPRQREVYQAMRHARTGDSLTTLGERLGLSRQRVHELIGLIRAAGVTLPPWAKAQARARRRALGWTRRKAAVGP